MGGWASDQEMKHSSLSLAMSVWQEALEPMTKEQKEHQMEILEKLRELIFSSVQRTNIQSLHTYACTFP